MTRRRGFTLVEIVVVLAIVMLLAALLLPVLNSARVKGRQAACASNLRQLGLAVTMYTQDYDSLFPRGGDPTDINTNAWQNAFNGQFAQDVKELRPLPIVMQPYVKSQDIWRCPADTGFDVAETGSGVPLNARPTSYDAFGTSYFYRTELTLRRKIDLVGFERKPPHTQHGPSDINVLFDGVGLWHGSKGPGERRYNVLMADGHVENMTLDEFNTAWSLLLDSP